MHDARFMGRDEPGHYVANDPKRGRHAKLPIALQDRGEIRALEERHRDVLDAVDFTEIVNADNVLVGHLASQDEFLLEPALHFPGRLRVACRFGTDDFERDALPQFRIPDLVHGTHAANSENFDDVVTGAKRLANCEGAGIHWVGGSSSARWSP